MPAPGDVRYLKAGRLDPLHADQRMTAPSPVPPPAATSQTAQTPGTAPAPTGADGTAPTGTTHGRRHDGGARHRPTPDARHGDHRRRRTPDTQRPDTATPQSPDTPVTGGTRPRCGWSSGGSVCSSALFLSCSLCLIALRTLLARHGAGRVAAPPRALTSRARTSPSPPSAGAILDRNGAQLAVSEDSATIYADPLLIKNPSKVADQLAPVLGMPTDELLRKLCRPQSRLRLPRPQGGPRQGPHVDKLKITGIGTLAGAARVATRRARSRRRCSAPWAPTTTGCPGSSTRSTDKLARQRRRARRS